MQDDRRASSSAPDCRSSAGLAQGLLASAAIAAQRACHWDQLDGLLDSERPARQAVPESLCNAIASWLANATALSDSTKTTCGEKAAALVIVSDVERDLRSGVAGRRPRHGEDDERYAEAVA